MLKKKFLKTKCKVQFSLPAIASPNIRQVHLVGSFNDWDEKATPLQKKGDEYTVTLDLPLNREYEFRYLVNGKDWYNDWSADNYIHSPAFGVDNSVVDTYEDKANTPHSEHP